MNGSEVIPELLIHSKKPGFDPMPCADGQELRMGELGEQQEGGNAPWGFFLMQLSGCQWVKSEGGAGFLPMWCGICYLPANLAASHSHANLDEKPQNKE